MPVVNIKSQSVAKKDPRPGSRPKKWWLRGGGGFVDLKTLDVEGNGTSREGYRGDYPIKIRGYLPPGEYLLGCGGKDDGVRERHVVGGKGE